MDKNIDKQLAEVSNRITDMTIEGAPTEQIAEAVRESMDLMDLKKKSIVATYVTKNECVTAVRLTDHNVKEIGELIKAEYVDECGGVRLYFERDQDVAYIGDWVVLGNDGRAECYTDAEFLGKYKSISEALSESEPLAKVNKIVLDAMHAARHGSPESHSWDVVAMLAAQHIIASI
jgi:hypothetical protein